VTRFDPRSGQWVPHAGIDDMQLEFTMLDPHIRTALVAVPDSPGTYAAQFRVPDRHGVFKFIVDYRRKGYVALSFSFHAMPD
jgi:oligosaccharyltransferase complex subunit beta